MKNNELLRILKNKKSLAKKHNQKYHTKIKNDRSYYDCTVEGSVDYPLANVAASNIINNYKQAGEDLHLTDENPENIQWLFISNAILKDAEAKYDLKNAKSNMLTDFVSGGKGIIKVVTEVKTKKKDLGLIDKFKGLVLPGTVEEEIVDDKLLHVDCIDPLKFYPMSDAGKTLENSCVFEEILKSKEEIEATYNIKISDDDLLDLTTGDKDLDEGLSAGEKEVGKKIKLWICWSPYALDGKKKQEGSYYLFSKNKVFSNKAMQYNPYVMFFNHEYADRDKELQPYGDIRLIKPLVEYLNDIKQDTRRYVRRVARSKWVVQKGADVDVNSLKDPKDGVIVEAKQMGAIAALEVPQLNPAVLMYANDTERFIEMISGMVGGDQTMQGVSTATGQAIVAQQGGTKLAGGFDNIAWGMEKVYRLILWNIYQNYDDEMIIEVVGEDLVRQFQEAERSYAERSGLSLDPGEFKSDSVREVIANTDNTPQGEKPFDITQKREGNVLVVKLRKNAIVEAPKIKVTIMPQTNKEIRLKRAVELYGLTQKDQSANSTEVLKIVARMMDVGIDPEKLVATQQQLMQRQQQVVGQAPQQGVPQLGGVGGETAGNISGEAAAL